jgi:hypothetical protein
MRGKMGNYSDLRATLLALAGDQSVIVINRSLVQFAGSLEGGILLGQLLYWTPRSDGGWIAKSRSEWAEELCISAYQVRKAQQALEQMGVLQTKLEKWQGAPTLHYRLDMETLVVEWKRWISQMDLAKPTNELDETDKSHGFGETDKSITETTETTPDNMHDSDDFIALFGPVQGSSEPPPRRTAEEYRQEVARSLQSVQHPPWWDYGAESNVMSKFLNAHPNYRRAIRHLLYELEHSFGLVPPWGRIKPMKRWLQGALECARTAEVPVVLAAARRLRENDMTVAEPWSLVKTASAIAAEDRSEAVIEMELEINGVNTDG